jgi:hypothetical protein
MIRVAILWHEMWHEGLEEASRLYYTVRNPAGMLAVLEPLHEMLEAVRKCFRYFLQDTNPGTTGPTNRSRNIL